MGVAAADFDNDGWTDLYVTGVRGNALYRNRGDGTFADVTREAGVAGNGTWSVAAGWFDYDGDGRLDLFVVNYVQWDPGREIYCGVSQEGHRSYCHPRYYGTLPNALYRNLGNRTFRDVSAASGIAAHRGKGMGLAFGDYDHDGRLDVFVANDTVANFLFHNEGNGTFRDTALQAGVAYNNYGVAISSMGGDFRDFDNDGWEDLFVTALTNEMFPLFRNQGDGTFVDVSGPVRIAAASMPWSGWGNGSYDFNNDGRKDFFAANGHAVDNIDMISSRSARQPNVVFLNQDDGAFRAVQIAGAALHRGAAFADFDGDGRVDAVVTRLNEAPVVLSNASDPAPATGSGSACAAPAATATASAHRSKSRPPPAASGTASPPPSATPARANLPCTSAWGMRPACAKPSSAGRRARSRSLRDPEPGRVLLVVEPEAELKGPNGKKGRLGLPLEGPERDAQCGAPL